MVCILLEVLLHWVGAGRIVVVLVVLGHVVLSRRHDVVGWLSVDGRSWQSRRTDERTKLLGAFMSVMMELLLDLVRCRV